MCDVARNRDRLWPSEGGIGIVRIRSIHPEFWRSEDVGAMDWDTRLVFIGLWSYVDDNGVGRDVERLIVADLFPLEDDTRETVARVSRALQTLSDGGQITRYSVAGKAYLHISAWEKWQRIDRPAKPRYPLPTSGDANPRETLARPSRDRRERPATGEGEKGRRGEGEKQTSSALTRDDDKPQRAEVEALCNHLADRIEANGATRPTVGKRWRDAARLMLDRDGRTASQIHTAIDWSQDDEFWRSNILSMSKLREKYDTLRLQASRHSTNGSRPSTTDRRVGAALELANKYAQEGL
jgi:hypothetical protein